jgi:adenine-specific DNA-methyltransferase
MALRRIHLFKSRTHSFIEDEVLQENVILHVVKNKDTSSPVIISSSAGPEDKHITFREVDANRVILPNDSEYFIHIVPDEIGSQIADKMRSLKTTLSELGIDVSTGKIVEFRCKDLLDYKPSSDNVPLIYPANIVNGFISFPLQKNKKPSYFRLSPRSKSLLLPRGHYVLVKRFSTNEEKRRIVAGLYNSNTLKSPWIGFENWVNYFHQNGRGLDLDLAKGLTLFLNSTIVDLFFRQFNGHTQVNATDLRNLRYPDLAELKFLGRYMVYWTHPENRKVRQAIDI